jgi:putative membrane protein
MLKKIKPVLNFLKGMVIGVSNLIPGVSGGTMALVMGIYERLVEAIGEFLTNKKRRKEFSLFLLPVILGAAAGILLFARVFNFLLSSPIYSQPTYFFFIGLILGSVPFLVTVHHDMKIRPARAIFFLIGLGLVVSLAFLVGRDNAVDSFRVYYSIMDIINIAGIDWKYALWLFFCGFLTSSAMVIPGVSGSALLLGLGEYRNILYFVSELMAVQLAVFGIGVIAGIVACARLIDFCLKRFPANTYYFIMGLVIASVFQIVMQSLEGFSLSLLPLALSFLAMAAGFALTYSLSPVKKKDKPEI